MNNNSWTLVGQRESVTRGVFVCLGTVDFFMTPNPTELAFLNAFLQSLVLQTLTVLFWTGLQSFLEEVSTKTAKDCLPGSRHGDG
jgi:hypothetical protein